MNKIAAYMYIAITALTLVSVSASQSSIQQAKAIRFAPSQPGIITNLGNAYDAGVQTAKDNPSATSANCPDGAGAIWCLSFGYGFNHEHDLLQQAGVVP